MDECFVEPSNSDIDGGGVIGSLVIEFLELNCLLMWSRTRSGIADINMMELWWRLIEYDGRMDLRQGW